LGSQENVRLALFTSDCSTMSGWTFSQIQKNIFLKPYLFEQVHKKL
jgi:hypothetical protein